MGASLHRLHSLKVLYPMLRPYTYEEGRYVQGSADPGWSDSAGALLTG